MSGPDAGAMLERGARELGAGLSADALDAFGAYLAELVKWNKKTNLTGIDTPKEIVVKHFLDSLALCRMLPEGPFTAADIGSGAGFPGLAVKLARPKMEVSLIEPARKKATFLRHVIRLLGMEGADVLECGAGELGERYTGRFDVIFSRAFRGPDDLLPLAGPLLKGSGLVALSLGPGFEGGPPPGWRAVFSEDITLPFSEFTRMLRAFSFSG